MNFLLLPNKIQRLLVIWMGIRARCWVKEDRFMMKGKTNVTVVLLFNDSGILTGLAMLDYLLCGT